MSSTHDTSSQRVKNQHKMMKKQKKQSELYVMKKIKKIHYYEEKRVKLSENCK